MTNVIPFRPCELEFALTADELAIVQARATAAGLSFEDYVRRQVLEPLSFERSEADGPAQEN